MKKKTTSDVDGGWAWAVAFGVFLSFFLLGGFTRSFGILYSAFLDMFGLSAATTSLIPAVRTACPIIVGPLSTTLSERYTERKVVIAGSLLISLGFITSFFATSLSFLIVSLGLIPGFGMSLLISPSNVAMGKYFSKWRSRVYSLTSCGVCLGMVVVPFLLTYLIDTFSIRGTLLIFGGICLNLIITGVVQRPMTVEDGDVHVPREANDNDRVNSDEEERMCTSGKLTEEMALSEYNIETGRVTSLELGAIKGTSASVLENNTIQKEHGAGVECKPSPNRLHSVSVADGLLQTESVDVEGMKRYSEIQANEDKVTVDAITSGSRQTHDSAGIKQAKQLAVGLLKDLFDLSLLKNYVYQIFLWSVTLSDVTYGNQSLYFVPLVELRGIPREGAAVILSVIGGFDVIGRLTAGFLADKRPLLPHHIMCICGIITGLVCCFLPLAKKFEDFVGLGVVFALVSSAPTLLIMPALAHSLGVASLARGLGLGMFFRGVFTAVTPPLFGLIKDVTGSYDAIFPIIGALQILGGLLLLLEPIAKRRMELRNTLTTSQNS
ncbi:monocarboxylate transporter 12-like [Liolophura sinensis]|uniref:monocarboxylate transporter 12-like n=1 Tax=Liolophura sinensis TaxID=3198878 RepID=UPI003158E057